jgi:hypothetical protein
LPAEWIIGNWARADLVEMIQPLGHVAIFL